MAHRKTFKSKCQSESSIFCFEISLKFQVECLASNLNIYDVFVLDLNTKIFIWKGEKAEQMLSYVALQVSHKINTFERNAEAKIIDLSSTLLVFILDDFL